MEWKSSCRSPSFSYKTKTPATIFYSIPLVFFFYFLSSCALFSTITTSSATCLDLSRCALSGKGADHNLQFQDWEQRTDEDDDDDDDDFVKAYPEDVKMEGSIPLTMAGSWRRQLGGPGSSPPRCTSKCGRCTPCKPVHVPVPPGTPVTAEYYPEAWRCKCGNKLYMP